MPLCVCLTLSAWNSLPLPCQSSVFLFILQNPAQTSPQENHSSLTEILNSFFLFYPLDFVHTTAPFLVPVSYT